MGYVRVRSPLLAESLLFSFPVGTEMVHFPTLSSTAYVFSGGFSGISQRGFPHSEIPGSKPICGSPGLIAAYRVLHRLLVPRHSPYTLSSLTIRNSSLRRTSFSRRTRCVSFMHTARVWSEKTTVCRIFSCQRFGRYQASSPRLIVVTAVQEQRVDTCQSFDQQTWWRIPGSNR